MTDDRDEMIETIEECGLRIIDELKQRSQTSMELSVVDESGVWVVTVRRLGIAGDGYRFGGLD